MYWGGGKEGGERREKQILYASFCSSKHNPEVSEFKILLVNFLLRRAKESTILSSQDFVPSVTFYPPGMESMPLSQ